VPHGGYIAALLLDSLILHQSTTSHPDVAHLTIQFLSPSSIGPIQLQISPVSVSKRWTRLNLASVQLVGGKEVTRCSAHALFTDLPDLGPAILPSPHALTMLPHTPSEFSRVTPFLSHSSDAESKRTVPVFNFTERLRWSNGSKNHVQWEQLPGRPRLDWAGWVELTEDNRIDLRQSAVLIGFFSSVQFHSLSNAILTNLLIIRLLGDLFNNGIAKLPKEQQPGASWLPTLTLSIDFKAKFPLVATPLASGSTQSIAARTVGTYNRTEFMTMGRYQAITEIWTAPSELGSPGSLVDKDADSWRKGMQILAVATQVSVIFLILFFPFFSSFSLFQLTL
jgi:hypothetical protein